MKEKNLKDSTLTLVTLVFSSSTLICCTLPLLLVYLGLGATVAALTLRYDFLITLAQHKFWLFLISGILLSFSYWSLRNASLHCPSDPILAAKCRRIMVWNRWVWRISILIWVIGFLSAYVVD